jgi:hypothetical protein
LPSPGAIGLAAALEGVPGWKLARGFAILLHLPGPLSSCGPEDRRG